MALVTSATEPIPVRQVVSLMGEWIDRLGPVWIEGQIVQVNQRRGLSFAFLRLRDQHAEVSVELTCPVAVLAALPTQLQAGSQVVVHAKPHLYPNRGSLSLRVRDIRLVGEGELLAQLERLRQLLAAEGLFRVEYKKPLPFLPQAIGLITAANSAAERDVIEVARRRWPGVVFEVRHCSMQGVNAVPTVLDALADLDQIHAVEVIIIARGGGSVEDLLPFSNEALIRAVAAASTPVVSAIGHEPDTPILDFVADLRAATPTDAAKQVVPDVAAELAALTQVRTRLRAALYNRLEYEQQQLQVWRSRPALAQPQLVLDAHEQDLASWRDRARRAFSQQLTQASQRINHDASRIRSLSPQATLGRGYAIVAAADGAHVTSIQQLAPDRPARLRLHDGWADVIVTATQTHQIEAPATPNSEDPHD